MSYSLPSRNVRFARRFERCGFPRTACGLFGAGHLGTWWTLAHRQVGLAETHRHGAIEPNLDSHVGSTQARTNAVACDLPSLTIHLNRIAVADLSGLHIAQRSSQRVFLAQRPVRIVAAGWDHGHRVVPPHDELRFQVSVGLLQGLCSGYTQAFDQTVLLAQYSAARVGPKPR